MIYNILWSDKEFGGAEIYVRKMKKEFGIEFFSIKNSSLKSKIKLFSILMNPNNKFIFHDIKASLLSLVRFFYFKDYFVVHGPGKNIRNTQFIFNVISIYSKKIILVSSFIYQKIPNHKFIIIENDSKFDVSCNPQNKDFIYFGRIEKSKGVDILCQNWPLNTDLTLHVIGDGSILHELKRKHNNNIIYYGSKKQNEIAEIIREHCGFYISCSPREGTSLSLSEAMSTGLIPIVTDIDTQKHLKKDLKLKLLSQDSTNFEEIFYYYRNMPEENIKDLHNKVYEYKNNLDDQFLKFWSKIFKKGKK